MFWVNNKDIRITSVAFISYFELVFAHSVIVPSSLMDLSNLSDIQVQALEKVSA